MKNNKVVGTIGALIGLSCLGSLFIGDNEKLIIPVSNIFLIRYCVIITIINAGFYFIIAGLIGIFGVAASIDSSSSRDKKKGKAKGVLLSLIILSPFLISIFTTIFVISETWLWKIIGSIALIYISYLFFTNILILNKDNQLKRHLK